LWQRNERELCHNKARVEGEAAILRSSGDLAARNQGFDGDVCLDILRKAWL
jgi:hypothetical protein